MELCPKFRTLKIRQGKLSLFSSTKVDAQSVIIQTVICRAKLTIPATVDCYIV